MREIAPSGRNRPRETGPTDPACTCRRGCPILTARPTHSATNAQPQAVWRTGSQTDQNRDQPLGDMIPAVLCGGPPLGAVYIALVLLDKTHAVPALALGRPGLEVYSGIELRHDFL